MERKPAERDMEYLNKWTRRSAITHGIPDDRLIEICRAERDGRCVVLSEPMKPMIYKPNDTDVYCPACGETLSDAWPLSDADDDRKMCQCPSCGQSIDDTRCESVVEALNKIE